MRIKQISQIFFQRTKLPSFEIELILAFALKTSRESVLAHPEHKLTPRQISNFKFQISKRIKGMPLAYITGHKEFFGLNFKVNKNVLIPRPETELMVEEALNRISQIANRKSQTLIIDIGTGSGCIIITLTKILKSKFQIFSRSGIATTNFKFLASDISKKALAIARRNARQHGVDGYIRFTYSNLLEPVLKNPNFQFQISNFIIFANLPYLTPTQIKKSPTIKYEPKQALDGGADGLKYYRHLFKQIKMLRVMSDKIPDSFVLCEIDPLQSKKIKHLIEQYLPKASCQIKKDLSGHNRLAIIKLTSN